MTSRQLIKIPTFVSFLLLLLIACQTETESSRLYSQISPYDFDDTLFNLDIAISEHNYRLIHRSDIGQAIRDRGEPEFPLISVINFCNITYAREMLMINIELVNDMACEIVVRESDSGVIVSTRLMDESTGSPEQQQFAKRMNKNIKKIVEATTL
jgi:uncharacterized protein (DUF302 family)